jgi:hypothetical protein
MAYLQEGFVTETNVFPRRLDSVSEPFQYSSPALITTMWNVPETLHGAPIFDSNGKILGIQAPVAEFFSSPAETASSMMQSIVIPASYLEDIVKQYRSGKLVRKPYVGIAVKSSKSSKGAFVI